MLDVHTVTKKCQKIDIILVTDMYDSHGYKKIVKKYIVF